MYFSLIDTLARIHAVDIDKVGLETYGKRRQRDTNIQESGYIARQIKVCQYFNHSNLTAIVIFFI